MSRHGLMVVAAVSLILSGCVDSLHSQPGPPKWTVGFWYWHQYFGHPAPADEKPDELYIHAGRIVAPYPPATGHWSADSRVPDSLPQAREYWLVFRADQQGVPDLSAVPMVTREISRLAGEARERRLKVAGIQLDIDSPTKELPRYAEFLKAVRKAMPPDLELSITGLLDWFREGTSIADVVSATDEFVPQFYDIDPPGSANEWRAIAAPIDVTKWAPRFNRLGKRYRIGISTFGRARFVPRPVPAGTSSGVMRLYRDVMPLDIGSNPAFEMQTSTSDAGEAILRYRATRKVFIGYVPIEKDDAVEFTFATPDSIRAAVKSARQMGGNCAGAIFFRWPAADETLVMQPDSVIAGASLAANAPVRARISAVDGECAAVSCVDLYLVNTNAPESHAVRYRIRSSVALEYFLPQEKMPVRMAGSSELDLNLPAYGGQSRMLLGRAVSKSHAEFEVEELR